jgi:Phasin protein
MAKRRSLHGAGREALAAATGKRPVEARSAPKPAERERARARPRVEAARVAPKRSAPEPLPAAEREDAGPAPNPPPAPALKGAAALYCEMLGFGRERISQALEAGQMLGECRTPAEAFETQAQFARRATEQCLRESFRMMELAAQAIGESWVSMQSLGLRDIARREAPPPK